MRSTAFGGYYAGYRPHGVTDEAPPVPSHRPPRTPSTECAKSTTPARLLQRRLLFRRLIANCRHYACAAPRPLPPPLLAGLPLFSYHPLRSLFISSPICRWRCGRLFRQMMIMVITALDGLSFVDGRNGGGGGVERLLATPPSFFKRSDQLQTATDIVLGPATRWPV